VIGSCSFEEQNSESDSAMEGGISNGERWQTKKGNEQLISTLKPKHKTIQSAAGSKSAIGSRREQMGKAYCATIREVYKPRKREHACSWGNKQMADASANPPTPSSAISLSCPEDLHLRRG
jgi:hypothetical protein